MSHETDEASQATLAEKAMALKKAGAEAPEHPAPDDHPNQGTDSAPRADYPPSGAFDAEGHRPVLERSRKVR
jgi:hypothetical protein